MWQECQVSFTWVPLLHLNNKRTPAVFPTFVCFVSCRINCQMCKRPLNQRPGKRRLLSWPWGGGKGKKSSKQGHSSEFLVCDCCQRCYHRHCCKQRGVSTKERDGVWFHDPSCKDCLQQLQDKVGGGLFSGCVE